MRNTPSSTARLVDRVLFPGKVVRIVAGPGGVLSTREGVLWVTWEACDDPLRLDGRDRFLAQHERLELEPGDVVVVGPADARYGVASFDWQPVRLLAALPAASPWRALLAAFTRRRAPQGLRAA